jgi:hypothetical protein
VFRGAHGHLNNSRTKKQPRSSQNGYSRTTTCNAFSSLCKNKGFAEGLRKNFAEGLRIVGFASKIAAIVLAIWSRSASLKSAD